MNYVGARKNALLIGLSQPEVACLRTVVSLLRHPDPTVSSLVHEAISYIVEAAARPYIPLFTPEVGASTRGRDREVHC